MRGQPLFFGIVPFRLGCFFAPKFSGEKCGGEGAGKRAGIFARSPTGKSRSLAATLLFVGGGHGRRGDCPGRRGGGGDRRGGRTAGAGFAGPEAGDFVNSRGGEVTALDAERDGGDGVGVGGEGLEEFAGAGFPDRKSTRLNSSHPRLSRMPSSA